MKRIWMAILFALLVCGCAALEQAWQDHKTGMNAPLEEGESSPKEQARDIKDILAPIPYVGTAAPAIATVLTAFFAWRRGRRIRKQMPLHPNPITGAWGQKIGLESIVQGLADMVAGVMEVGKDGTGMKRAWKVGIATAFGLVTTSLASPQVQHLLLANPDIFAALVAVTAGFAGLDKKLSQIQPVIDHPAPVVTQ